MSERFVGQVTELATFENTPHLYTEKFAVSLMIFAKIYKKFTIRKPCLIISEQSLFNMQEKTNCKLFMNSPQFVIACHKY